MAERKRPRGRPAVNPLPPRADATPEELVQAFFQGKPGDEVDFPRVYYCAECGEQVSFPDILYRDKRCADCTTYSARS